MVDIIFVAPFVTFCNEFLVLVNSFVTYKIRITKSNIMNKIMKY